MENKNIIIILLVIIVILLIAIGVMFFNPINAKESCKIKITSEILLKLIPRVRLSLIWI